MTSNGGALSKPCARGGCTGVVLSTSTERRFHRQRFCSNRCAALDRTWRGDLIPRGTLEQYQKGGRNGGRASAVSRRKIAMRRWGAAVDVYLPADLRESLTSRQLAAVRALLVKVGKAASQGRILRPSPREQGTSAS